MKSGLICNVPVPVNPILFLHVAHRFFLGGGFEGESSEQGVAGLEEAGEEFAEVVSSS